MLVYVCVWPLFIYRAFQLIWSLDFRHLPAHLLTGLSYKVIEYIKFYLRLSCTTVKRDLKMLGIKSEMKKITNISVRETIIFILIGIAYGLFAYFALYSFFEYSKELTGINQEIESVKDLSLPTITVCSQEVFKNVKNDTTTEMVLQNLSNYVFSWDDLFDGYFTVLASQLWYPPRQIFSTDLGLCYSLRNKNKANPRNHYFFYIFLPVGKKYQVCLFAPTSELLMIFLGIC